MSEVARAKQRLAEAQYQAKQAAKQLKAAKLAEAREKIAEARRKADAAAAAKKEADETLVMIRRRMIGRTIESVSSDGADCRDSLTINFTDGTNFTIVANGGDELGGWLTYGD